MGEIHVHEFMTLNGVADAPVWTFDYPFTDGMAEVVGAITDRSDAILLGRTTYEMFEPAWSSRTVDDDPGAPFFNETRKYVVSATLGQDDAAWNNTEILGPYDPERIRRLKADVAGSIYVSGSTTLVRAMLSDGLVDQLDLLVYPLTKGDGAQLFPAGSPPFTMTLAEARPFDNGVMYLAYRPRH